MWIEHGPTMNTVGAMTSKVPFAPGLTASMDQHAAMVRDVIAGSGLEVTPQTLTDYRDGFLAQLAERGWQLRMELDWRAIRLFALERMIDEALSATRERLAAIPLDRS